MTSRASTAAPILAALAIVLVTLGAYVGGYFFAGQTVDWRDETGDPTLGIDRVYPAWLAPIYQPAGKVESWVRGTPVDIGSPHEVQDSHS